MVQFRTAQPGDFFKFAQIMFAGRQMAMALPICTAGFGGDPAGCAGHEESEQRLFPANGRALSSEAARDECGRLGASHLIATRWDKVWADRSGWVWTLPDAVDTGEVRVLECGGHKGGIAESSSDAQH